MEKHNILLAIVLGLLGANLYISLSPGRPARKAPPKPSYSVGQEIDVAITLVSTDKLALACASEEEVAGRHCEFEASRPPKRFSRELTSQLPDEERILAPYKTTGDVMFLIPGLFSQPALIERLEVDPPVFGVDRVRFNAHCKLKILGKVSKVEARWSPKGQFGSFSDVHVGTVSGCTVSI